MKIMLRTSRANGSRSLVLFLFFFGMNYLLNSHLAFAQSKIFLDVGEAKVRKSKLAFPEIQYLGTPSASKNSSVGTDLFKVIQNDLDATGLFINLNPDSFLESVSETGLKPIGSTPNGFDFKKWKALEAEFLIRGGYQLVGNNITLEIYGYYVSQGNLIIGKKYEGPVSKLRKIAHTFANDFIKGVTGKSSFFDSRIVVTIDSGPKTNREVYISDWDGFNSEAITKHKTITVSPAWSKNGELVAYTAFVKRKSGTGPAKRNPDLFIYELKTKRRWLVSYRDGLNSGAEFLPDNKNILLTLSRRRAADIYKMSTDGKTISPITDGPGGALNVEPAISPDGNTIAFSSDRSGKPMIYTMDINGKNVNRRTFAGHYNSTPSWSPDGKKLAFAGFDKDKSNFDIFVINLDTRVITRLTSAKKANGKWANNEDPAFSPDGRHVLFVSDRAGAKQLYLVGVDGSNERRITYDTKFYSKPKWGPPED